MQKKIKQSLKMRMMRAKRSNYKDWMIYPENNIKFFWDIFVTLLLVVSCFITPLQLCDLVKMQALTMSIDCLFGLDMIIIFNSAILTDDFETIDDRGQIAFHYFSTWFFIDLISIIPFELMIKVDANSGSSSQVAQVNQMLRILRIGKLTKLFKLMKLLRVLKIMKTQEKV